MRGKHDNHSAVEWKIASACVAGRGHSDSGANCQDAYAIKRKNDILAVCLCDGAGSARYSEDGANIVANSICDFLIKESVSAFNGTMSAKLIIDFARESIASFISSHKGSLKDYACTLVAMLLKADQGIAVHIGDGLIAIVEAGRPRVLSAPDNTEFANQTTFITSPDAQARLRIQSFTVPEIATSFALMTDGAQASLYQRKGDIVSQVVEQMASWLDSASENEASVGIQSVITEHLLSQTFDDCSVVILRNTQASFVLACPECKRWDIQHKQTEKTTFLIRCENCGHCFPLSYKIGRKYPVEIRRWVSHLVKYRKMNLSQVHKTTGISTTTLRRWNRSYPTPSISCQF